MSNPLAGLPPAVTVVEVGPRDGLQNEAGVVAAAEKIRFVDLLSAAGLRAIEVSSFVSPRAVPQLADADAVFAGITRWPGTRYDALVPNRQGMERALAAGVDQVAVFTGASETFVQHNIRSSIAGSIEQFRPVVEMARAAGLPVRGYISTVFACPYEGPIAPEAVVRVAEDLLALGVGELSLGDTIGVGTPDQVVALVEALRGVVNPARLAMHFHDTRGTALANVLVALQLGITTFDSAAGGLGGCPYAPGATGNLATEDLLYLLHGLGIQTGVDLARVVEASAYLASVRHAAPPSRYYAAARSS